MQTFHLFVTIAGLIIGIGAVTVIDIIGFLGRKSGYWSEAAIRVHKVTKPMIWIGMALVFLGAVLMKNQYLISAPEYNLWLQIMVVLIINGFFLSFFISHDLQHHESKGLASHILPKKMQNKILVSFGVSFVGWWSLVFLFINTLQ
jgi:membrane protein YdbS with pleckstrin-like domain